MEAKHAHVIGLVAHELHVALVVLALGHGPLERLQVRVIDLDVRRAVLLQRVLLRAYR